MVFWHGSQSVVLYGSFATIVCNDGNLHVKHPDVLRLENVVADEDNDTLTVASAEQARHRIDYGQHASKRIERVSPYQGAPIGQRHPIGMRSAYYGRSLSRAGWVHQSCSRATTVPRIKAFELIGGPLTAPKSGTLLKSIASLLLVTYLSFCNIGQQTTGIGQGL